MIRLHPICGWLVLVAVPNFAQADVDVRDNVHRGLEWLAKSQNKDGSYYGPNSHGYPTAMTALAGMCFLMEGSTMTSGRYSDNIRRATDWFLKRAQPTGLLGNPILPGESERYMYGHGFGLLFLSCVYGEEDDERKRKELEKVLSKAVLFCGKAQTSRGGWGYTTAADGGDFDEGSVTITQLQALRAARNAGIHVPKSIIDKATKYLRDCTTSRGGIIYSLSHGNPAIGAERPALTAAAVACAFSAGNYNDEYARKWLKFCKENIPFGSGRLPHDEYQNYYFSQCVYVLGDDNYARLFPKDNQPLRWSDYRKAMFIYIQGNQTEDGSWKQGEFGPVYATAINLTILQLENAALPIYQR